MFKYLAIGLVAAGTFMFATSNDAHAYRCRADSPQAYGWGYHSNSLRYARDRALYECAVRTPRGYTCYITSCRR
ncbi:MAG: hypothetical protein KF794_03385 [Xanthobacteraceae bacterium]|nr:hypothetical protein [Xanthobacteraceae bacterium]QYK45751.1 MAG: hypothetical protein KF794_03385 [Xanthobacteraceae bacterium]